MNVILSHLILNLYHFDVYKSHLVNKSLSCVWLCMCSHMWVGASLYVCMCTCIWRPENWHMVSSLTVFHLMCWPRVSHLNPELTNSANLASHLALGIPSPSPVLGLWGTTPPAWCLRAGDWNSASVFAWQALYQLTIVLVLIF